MRKNREFNYILISVDTLRADRIACYGFHDVETPTMDLFASRGVLFEKCIAPTPLTLPSHTSLLTGTLPLFHGVRDNGGFLVPQELETLAEVFKQKNYSTSAFVAAYVLDSKWGLDQGFDHYFDEFDLSKYKSISLGNVQRRGDEVIDETLAWLDQHKNEKFFTWIHMYDPHTPYDPPSPYRERYPNRPYIGEIAYTDSQLGRLWGYLEENDLVENTILIFVADHGESLGEHQESTHGYFVYQEGIHVPLIVVTPFPELHNLRRRSVVSLVDIMPTFLEMDDIPVPSQVQGESLLPKMFSEGGFESSIAYAETYYPRFHYGWSDLKTIQERQYKLIIAPDLELYDLDRDPEERENLVDVQPAEARRLLNLADQFIFDSGRGGFELDYRNLDEQAREKLAALGYIGTFADQSALEGRALANPREKIGIFNRLSQSKELMLEEKYEEAESLIQSIIQEDPEVIDAYFSLGNLYFKQRQFQDALDSFFIALEKRPNDAFTVINIINSYMGKGDFTEAERFVFGIVDTVPPDSQLFYSIGNIMAIQEKYDEAILYYEKCMKLNPTSASAYSAIGGVLVKQGKLDEGERFLLQAKEVNPQLRELHFNLALLHEERQEFSQAADEYRLELENNPYSFRASFNLSRIYRFLKDDREEERYLNKTMEINPHFSLSYFYLARIYLNRGTMYQEAIALTEKGISLNPPKVDLPLGYFLLADLYNRLGEQAKSQENLEKGKALVAETQKKEDKQPLSNNTDKGQQSHGQTA
jgi:arylsulfatase A-like enzyme/Tfp pilus assembly protein PilF